MIPEASILIAGACSMMLGPGRPIRDLAYIDNTPACTHTQLNIAMQVLQTSNYFSFSSVGWGNNRPPHKKWPVLTLALQDVCLRDKFHQQSAGTSNWQMAIILGDLSFTLLAASYVLPRNQNYHLPMSPNTFCTQCQTSLLRGTAIRITQQTMKRDLSTVLRA